MPHQPNTNALFMPKSVAIIGNTQSEGTTASHFLRTICQAGFSGKVFAVNGTCDRVQEIEAVRKVTDIPALPLDLAILCLPQDEVLPCIDDLKTLGTKAVLVATSALKEAETEGMLWETEIAARVRKYGMTMLGPHSFGVATPRLGFNATLSGKPIRAGGIGFFSQSSSIFSRLIEWADQYNFGFSTIASLGGNSRMDEAEIIAFLANDPNTKVILGYVEGVTNGPRFLHNAHLATRKKPVILLKSGRTFAGARAASAHSCAMPGSNMAYDAAFKQTGIIRVKSLPDLFHAALAFSGNTHLPAGPGVAIVANAGAPAIIATDAVHDEGLNMVTFSQKTIYALRDILPSYASLYNPVDTATDVDAHTFSKAIQAVLDDSGAHSLLVIAAETDHLSLADLAAQIVKIMTETSKTVLLSFIQKNVGTGMGGAGKILSDAGLCSFRFPDSAINALSIMFRHTQWKKNPMPIEVSYRRDFARARLVIDNVLNANHVEIPEIQAMELLRAYEMPVLETKLARTSDEAVQIAKQLGRPVALKISSPQIQHRSDCGGVVLGLSSPESIKKAFAEITTKAQRINKGAYIAGCVVQAMAPRNARETVVGFTRDKHFGPVVYFGISGIHRETLKDMSYRLAPLSLNDPPAMMREIRAFPMLTGNKGTPPIKFTALEDVLLIMSSLAVDFPEIQEAECDPVFVNEHGALVMGMHIVLDKNAGKRSTLLL